MDIYNLIAVIFTLTVAFALINYRYIKLPTTIAMMLGSMLLSITLVITNELSATYFTQYAQKLLNSFDFGRLLMKGMLSFLLFAGSMSIDFTLLKKQLNKILTLATVGTAGSTVMIALMCYYLLPLFNHSMPFLFCLLFGSLISPTDPIAVLSTFKRLKVPQSLHVLVAGESLFNDGVGIVLFITLYELTFSGTPITVPNVAFLFIKEAIGGALYGYLIGYAANELIKLSNETIAVLITLAIVTSGYALANALGISGPLAMVIAGLLIGNKARRGSLQDKINQTLQQFWIVIEDVLNTILFFLIGLEILEVDLSLNQAAAAIAIVPIVLLCRWVTIKTTANLLIKKSKRSNANNDILVWGGLRGGLSIALALSLPNSTERNLILGMTFAVVAFSILVQGTTINTLIKKKIKNA